MQKLRPPGLWLTTLHCTGKGRKLSLVGLVALAWPVCPRGIRLIKTAEVTCLTKPAEAATRLEQKQGCMIGTSAYKLVQVYRSECASHRVHCMYALQARLHADDDEGVTQKCGPAKAAKQTFCS